MSFRNVRTGYYYKVVPAAEDPEENEKPIFERNILGVPISVLALLIGGLLAERKISGTMSIAILLSSAIISKG